MLPFERDVRSLSNVYQIIREGEGKREKELGTRPVASTAVRHDVLFRKNVREGMRSTRGG